MEASRRFAPEDLPRRLSPGRQRVSREEIDRIQRERILAAVGDVAGVGGFAALSVDAVTATAGMSRRTFYEYFKNKDDAFLAAYERSASVLENVVEHAFGEAERVPADRAIRSMIALTQVMVAEPTLTQMCIVEVLAADTRALARRDESIRKLAALISRAVDESALEHVPPETTAQAIVGGIYEVIHSRLLNGRLAELPSLVPDFVYAVILPFLGVDAARAAYADAQAAVSAPPDSA